MAVSRRQLARAPVLAGDRATGPAGRNTRADSDAGRSMTKGGRSGVDGRAAWTRSTKAAGRRGVTHNGVMRGGGSVMGGR